MKSITLRTLVREPLKVKRWTRTGQSVQVTDRGEPLWIVQPAVDGHDEEERCRAVNAILDEVLRETKSRVSLSRIIRESRR
jgi:hypothetical protein